MEWFLILSGSAPRGSGRSFSFNCASPPEAPRGHCGDAAKGGRSSGRAVTHRWRWWCGLPRNSLSFGPGPFLSGAPLSARPPPPRTVGHQHLLMLFAVYLFAASGMKTASTRYIRHPQLTAVNALGGSGTFSVNGDLQSIVLFAGCWPGRSSKSFSSPGQSRAPPPSPPSRRRGGAGKGGRRACVGHPPWSTG